MTILLKETCEPIGRIQISRIDPEYDSLDITRIYIAEDRHRRNGLGEEAMRLILEYCFIQLHMERVTLDYVEGNHPAEALYRKLGFKEEGVARHGGKKNGMYLDLHMMSLLRIEYYNRFKSEEL
jgi:RimJ/RimL family protein N-acetyltransferase